MADIRQERSGDRVVLTISGELTAPHAKALKTALLDVLKNAAAVAVAVADVSDMDISFPQLLCSAHRTAIGQEREMTVTGLDQERVGQVLRNSGFLRHIGCQEGSRKSCLWLHCGPAVDESR